jgi:putative toxin-antitoxin system antitoxin component (TIGR02293 family)
MSYMTYRPNPSQVNHPVALVLGLRASNLVELTQQIEKGFPAGALDILGAQLETAPLDLASLLGVSARTLQRSKVSLSPAVSDHLYRLGNLLDVAVRFHGSREAAVRWLKSPNLAFVDVTPLEYARTEAGTQAILDLLHGLEHGVVQ